MSKRWNSCVRHGMRHCMRHGLRLSLCLPLCLIGAPLALAQSQPSQVQPAQSRAVPSGSVTARLDRPQVPIDETVTLTVTATDLEGELDTSALELEFDVVGRSRSTQVDVLNGVRRDRASWVLELAPRRKGVLSVPSVSVQGVSSAPVTLEVVDAATGGDRDIFVEADLDESAPWVQSQVLMTVRVFQAVDFIDAALAEPRGDGMRIERLGDDRRARAERDGREYDVTERRYAVFPQRSGRLTIEPITLDATVPLDPGQVRGFFTPSRRLVRRSDAIEVNVRGRPPGSTGWWLPARALSIAGVWAGEDAQAEDPDQPSGNQQAVQARVGVPLTRILTIRALGVTGSQLPELEPPTLDGAALYAEAPEVNSVVDEQGVVTEQRLTWAVVPERAGTLVLPAVTLAWFDTIAGVARTAELPAQELQVQPAGTTPSTAASTTPGPQPQLPSDQQDADPALAVADNAVIGDGPGRPGRGYWPLGLGLALAGWLATGVAWAMRERRLRAGPTRGVAQADADPTQPSAAAALKALGALEAGNDAPALARQSLRWSQARWPDRPPASLPQIAARLAPHPIAVRLRALDAAAYGGSLTQQDWSGLAAGLREASAGDAPAESTARRQEALPPL